MSQPRIAYRDGYKYQLADYYSIQTTMRPRAPIITEWITLGQDGVLTIRAGYAWDGATNAPDWNCAKRPSLVHDALYQLIGFGFLATNQRAYADALFQQLLTEDGMRGRMAAIWHRAVSTFGPKGGSTPKPVKFAP